MTRQDCIRAIAEDLMVDDEFLEYYDAMTKAEQIYYGMYQEEQEDGTDS
jgi:hypothetical protein